MVRFLGGTVDEAALYEAVAELFAADNEKTETQLLALMNAE